jgi:enamine deaminase RidA (YjgF/YER057c/UK114 family)
MVYCSGFIGCDQVDDLSSHSRQHYGLEFDLKLIDGGVKAQTVCIFNKTQITRLMVVSKALIISHLSKALATAGSSLDDIVQAKVYLTNFERDFAEMNRVWLEVSMNSE